MGCCQSNLVSPQLWLATSHAILGQLESLLGILPSPWCSLSLPKPMNVPPTACRKRGSDSSAAVPRQGVGEEQQLLLSPAAKVAEVGVEGADR